MLSIKKANFEDIEKEWSFVRDMPEDENGLTNAWQSHWKLPEQLFWKKKSIFV